MFLGPFFISANTIVVFIQWSDLFFTELLGKKFLQPPLPGPFCCFCDQLHSSLLQGTFVFKYAV